MPFPKGQNPNHPAAGSTIKVEPIRDKKAIVRIKKILADRPRELCLFTLGINTAYRANELLSLKVGQVKNLQAGDVLDTETAQDAQVPSGDAKCYSRCVNTSWLASGDLKPEDYLFMGQRGCLTVETMSTRVKTWCHDVGLKGNYGSHTLRKTWGYWQRLERGTAIPLLMEAFGHATQQQTLAYLGIQSNEIAAIYELEL
jgi:integrase